MGNKFRLVGIFLLLITIFLYARTSAGNTAFNHFTLLADSFLNGKLYIEGNMPWLEKIPIDDNRFYVANPPMPAILAMLPVAIYGRDFSQPYLSYFISALIVFIVFNLTLEIKKDIKLAIWSSVFVGFSTINWHLGTVGSTWYLGQTVAELFFFVSIYSLVKQKNPFITAIFLGSAYLARIPVILALPFFLINLPKPVVKNIFLFGLGLTPFILFNFLYNYMRFGVIWDIGYTMIPGVSTEPWYHKGIVHPSYIINHLKIIFTSLPTFSKDFPYFKPSFFGYAIWFTSPAFIFSFFAKFKEKIVWSSWIGITLISLLIFSHGSTGFSQFGYRFAVDFYPLLTLITIKGIEKQNGPRFIHWLLLIIGIVVNLWGVTFINIFNWTS